MDVVIDAETGMELGRIEYEEKTSADQYICDSIGKHCYGSLGNTFKLIKLDVEKYEVAGFYKGNIHSQPENLVLTKDNKWLFVTVHGSSREVHIINTETMTEHAVIDMKSCQGLADVEVQPDGKKLFISCWDNIYIYELNLP